LKISKERKLEEQWYLLQEALRGNHQNRSKIEEPFFHRVLVTIESPSSGVGDILSAYRDALKCACAHKLTQRSLKFSSKFFSSQLMNGSGLSLDNATSTVSLVNENLVEEERDVYTRIQRRHLKKVPIDISLQKVMGNVQFKFYNGFGQALAIRETLLSNADDTLIINLPTGSGKTLVAHSIALFSNPNAFHLVIVPTVGLALEQAQRVKEMFQLAGVDHGGEYHLIGGQQEESVKAIFDRMNSNTQKVLFTSPEMATRKLLPILFRLAATGYLATFIVDEAHLIDQWGAEFRGEFQLLAPLLMSLRGISPKGVRAILMSATFSSHTVSTLIRMYSGEKIPKIIDGSFLRPEPTYKVSFCKTEFDHHAQVEKAILALPRPLIIYTSTQEEARYWNQYLSSKEIRRVGLFTGETGNALRGDLIKKWREGEIDVMVATSAFGVGMDNSDVRSVLHVSIPESIDRFYQESGRGGRDGKASLSYLICHEQQFEVAEKLSAEKLITAELGLKRWVAMLNSSSQLDDGRLLISLDAEHYGISRASDKNRMWNWLTLLLMRRADMIRLHFNQPEPPEECIDEDASERLYSYYQTYFNTIVVELIDDEHRSSAHWDVVIGEQRKNEFEARSKGLNFLKEWILDSSATNPRLPLCELLRQFYSLNGFMPEVACGGCPSCQTKHRNAYSPTLGLNARVYDEEASISLFGKLQRVYYPYNQSRSMLLREWKNWLLRLLSSGVVKAIRADAETLDELSKIFPRNVENFWISLELGAPACAYDEIVLVFSQADYLPKIPTGLGDQIIIAPENMLHRDYSYRTWWEGFSNSIPLESFIRQVEHVNN